MGNQCLAYTKNLYGINRNLKNNKTMMESITIVLFIILYAFKAFDKHVLAFLGFATGSGWVPWGQEAPSIYGISMGIIYGKAWVDKKVATYKRS